jgi:hypothetical protein
MARRQQRQCAITSKVSKQQFERISNQPPPKKKKTGKYHEQQVTK